MTEFIQHNQGSLMVAFFVLSMALLAVAVFFGIMLRNTEKKADQRLKQARADITDMTILFQTMRDIIGQQKSLAKDFNEEIEHKMEQVKHILNQGMEKNKQLYDKQQRIVLELEEAQARIDGIYRQIALTNTVSASGGPTPTAPTPKPRPESNATPTARPPVTPSRPAASPRSAPVRPATSEASGTIRRPAQSHPRDEPMPPRSPVIRTGKPPADSGTRRSLTGLSAEEEARLTSTGVTKAPYSSWVAEDLPAPSAPASPQVTPRPAEASPKPAARPETTPATAADSSQADDDPVEHGPNNGDAAREAFRALLNMPATTAQPDFGPLDVVPREMDMGRGTPENGELDDLSGSAPLQQRVLEYSEAGMTVAQVSRELGIGKGEVRLMLSLAKQKSPQRE